MRLFKRKQKQEQPPDPHKIVGVTLGWGLKPQLCFEDGRIYCNSTLDKLFHPDYFIDGQDWPVDPITKEKLPIAESRWVNG